MGHRLALISFLFLNGIAFSQTYTVLNETTGTTFVDTLDGTTEFRFSVRLSGSAGTLTGVVPELVPPACAQQGGQPIFNTTYTGIVGGSATSLAVPTWSNNQTRELVFQVHMFNNTQVCGTGPVCGGVFNFQLRFTHSGNTNPVNASDPSDFLDINGPPTDGFRVIDTVSETPASACDFYIGNNRRIPVNYFGFPASLRNDPEVRVFLGIDWNLNINNRNPVIDFAFGVSNFFYPTGPQINDAFMLKSAGDSDPRVPPLPEDTVILGEDNVPFIMGPLGGDGPLNGINDCVEETWNFFDITNEQPVAGNLPPLINNLSATATNQITMSDSVSQINFRKAGIYLVKPADCQSEVAFGNPPSPTQIQFEEYNLLPGNIAEVTLALPSSWTTAGGTLLNTNFTIEWYYRNNGTLTRANLPGGGATPPRNLSTNLSIPFTDPTDFVIEARIRRAGSNAVISFQSPGHDLSYTQLASRSIENGEFNSTTGLNDPDQYLDPGEVLAQELRVQNQGSFASAVTVTAGRISNGADFAFGSRQKTRNFLGAGDSQQVFQTNLSTNANFDVDVLYELLQTDQACGDLDLYVEVSYVNQGMMTLFRHEFSTPSNCEFVENAFSLDGTWTDAENFGTPPCTGSNCTGSTVNTSSPTTGWGFTDPEWVGSTSTRAFFYTLTSPAAGFPVGLESKVAMRHDATFRLLDAGGIVEYRTRNTSGGWSNWQDLITPLENENSIDIYNHSRRFTTTSPGVDNVIGDRFVFMEMGGEQNFDLALPDTTLTQDLVQVRFLYHLVNDASPAPGLWQISEFDFKTKLPQFDDLFMLSNNLMFNACNPTIALAPQPADNYTYFWYTSFQNLVDDVVHFTSTDGVWNFPIPPNSTDYYVKIEKDSPGTTRIYKLEIEATTAVPPFGTVLEAWNTVGSPGNTDINSSGMVDVIDLILQLILDNCD